MTVSLNEDGKPVIEWNKISYSPSPTYRLVYSTSKDGSYINIDADEDGMGWVYGTSYTHTDAVANTTYWYKVCAFDEEGNIDSSAYSTPVSITVPQPEPAGPTISVSLNEDGKPVISWSAVEGAVGYHLVYICSAYGEPDDPNTPWTDLPLGNAIGTSVVHEDVIWDTTYVYKICAIFPDPASNSAYSDPVRIDTFSPSDY